MKNLNKKKLNDLYKAIIGRIPEDTLLGSFLIYNRPNLMLNRDWKILELMTDGDKVIDGIGPIKSVRRLSDNKIFTIGDKTFEGPISSFFIVAGDMFVQVGYVKMYGYDGVYKCSHLPLRILD